MADLQGQVAEAQEESGRGVPRARAPRRAGQGHRRAAGLRARRRRKAVRQELDRHAEARLGQQDAALRELRTGRRGHRSARAAAAAPGGGEAGGDGHAETRRPRSCTPPAMASFRSEEHGQAVLEFTRARRPVPAAPARVELAVLDRRGLLSPARLPPGPRRVPEACVDGYPQSAQVPEALLKLGLCQRALKDTRGGPRELGSGGEGLSRARVPRVRRAHCCHQLGGQGRGAR